ASVTVSMAAERMGICTPMARVTRELTSTLLGNTSEAAGRISTSAKVRATSELSGNLSSGDCPSGIGQPHLGAGGIEDAKRLKREASEARSVPPVGGFI